jgi:DNA-binding response OmpR family regulator
LRRKLQADVIETRRGYGYLLNGEPAKLDIVSGPK